MSSASETTAPSITSHFHLNQGGQFNIRFLALGRVTRRWSQAAQTELTYLYWGTTAECTTPTGTSAGGTLGIIWVVCVCMTAPRAVSQSSGRIDVFHSGEDGAIYRKQFNGENGWTPSFVDWEKLGGLATSRLG
jgi:hypothetical protein